MRFTDEGQMIGETLLRKIPKEMDGRECIGWMRQHGTQWRQMEWPGFFFEEYGRDVLTRVCGGEWGPKFGRTQFDYRRDFVWDLKLHSAFDSKGRPKHWVILNDLEAFLLAIEKLGGLGLVIGVAQMEFDHDGRFKLWHEKLKGGPSEYQRKRRAEGAWSRIRKVRGNLIGLDVFFFDSDEALERGLREGWLGNFQEGLRNANDRARRKKLKLCLGKVPDSIKVFSGRP